MCLGAQIKNVEVVELVAELLECPTEDLTKSLLFKTMTTTARRGSVYKIPLKLLQAQDCRDAFAKARTPLTVYSLTAAPRHSITFQSNCLSCIKETLSPLVCSHREKQLKNSG